MVRKPSLNGWRPRLRAVSAAFPTAMKVGVADGAKTNWSILTQQTERQILDFYHAVEYLASVADIKSGWKTII